MESGRKKRLKYVCTKKINLDNKVVKNQKGSNICREMIEFELDIFPLKSGKGKEKERVRNSTYVSEREIVSICVCVSVSV